MGGDGCPSPEKGRRGDARSDQHVNREGYVQVHQYSTHYDPAIRKKLEAGNITASDLKPKS
jgi:hypothetical protein